MQRPTSIEVGKSALQVPRNVRVAGKIEKGSAAFLLPFADDQWPMRLCLVDGLDQPLFTSHRGPIACYLIERSDAHRLRSVQAPEFESFALGRIERCRSGGGDPQLEADYGLVRDILAVERFTDHG
jgi:hypothetical protein